MLWTVKYHQEQVHMPVIVNINSDYKTEFPFFIKRNVIELALQLAHRFWGSRSWRRGRMVKEGGLPLLVNGVPWVRISVSQARGHLDSWSSPAKLSALDDVKVWIRIKVQGNNLKT